MFINKRYFDYETGLLLAAPPFYFKEDVEHHTSMWGCFNYSNSICRQNAIQKG